MILEYIGKIDILMVLFSLLSVNPRVIDPLDKSSFGGELLKEAKSFLEDGLVAPQIIKAKVAQMTDL